VGSAFGVANRLLQECLHADQNSLFFYAGTLPFYSMELLSLRLVVGMVRVRNYVRGSFP